MCKVEQVILFLCVLCIPAVVFALGMENFGDRPIEISCDWYDGVAAVAQSPGLVYSRWVNGGEIFCYKDDTNSFNNVLQKFVAVSSPVRRLVIEAGPGTIKSLQGDKEFAFDWKLHVVSGIHLSMLIGDNIARKDEIYPYLTLFLGSDNIDIEQLNIPAGIDVVIAESVSKDPAMSTKIKKLTVWIDALAKWRQFVQPHLEKIRKDTNDPTVNCIEIRSWQISQYLPRHRIFAIETTKYPFSNLFAVSVAGEIKDLSKQMLDLSNDNKRLSYPSISLFLRSRKIKIADANTAISVIKLTEEIFSAAKNVARLKLDTNYFTVFDNRLYPGSCEGDNWQYTAERQDLEWVIKKNFFGQPTCLAYRHTYGISVDQNDLFQDLWEIH